MKKFFGIFFALMLISSSCFAMKFSQPVKLGSAVATDSSFSVCRIEDGTQVRDGISNLTFARVIIFCSDVSTMVDS